MINIVSFLQNSSSQIFLRLEEFVYAPVNNIEMAWILIPLVFTLLVMEFYFNRHKSERLSWGSATANSLVLIFVSMDLFRHLYNTGNLSLSFSVFDSYGALATALVGVIFLEGILLFILDFFHLWPKFFALRISSFLTVNLVAYIAVVLIYSGMVLDIITAAAVVLFFIVVSAVFLGFRMIMPRAGKF